MGTRVPPTPLCDKAMAGLPQLLDDLHRLSEDQDSADVVFLLGREEERVYAHKIMLMARYKYIFFLKVLLISEFLIRAIKL